MKSELLKFLRERKVPQTAGELAEGLETTIDAVMKEVYNLKAQGIVQECTLEQMLRLEK